MAKAAKKTTKRSTKKPAKKATGSGATKTASRPRAQRLPGTEDSALIDLENAAVEYEEARDERIAASLPEVEKKGRLIVLMKKHEKVHYKRGDLVIDLTVEKENVKVRRVKVKGKDDDEPFVDQF